MINTDKKPNKLINEKSPYLLQHAHNPVDWYPWGQEAFDKAIGENKPIFLSIGYSTCHWCHVMERESFEDDEVAALMNRYFIAIKVDREERPDIDHLYMEFCQALTGAGGWPLTIIMTPDKKQPFFAGTYFPKTQHYGRPGLLDILVRVGELWVTNEAKLRESAEEIVRAIQEQRRDSEVRPTTGVGAIAKTSLETPLNEDGSKNAFRNNFKAWAEEVLNEAYRTFERTFDPVYGGFGQAPKFPTPHILGFLLRYAKEHPQSKALDMVHKTLSTMASGGIYDHIGCGFARYSTDQKWLVPHFEKMLYDNALLALAYLESYQAAHTSENKRIAEEIFTYVMRDMQAPEGGFYSAEDADSEGVEGKFYVWKREEIKQILGEEDERLFCDIYDITPRGNFEGTSIPNLLKTNSEKYASKHNIPITSLQQRLEASRQKLFNHRENRIHPHKDDKILTSWNGLMIAAFAKGAQVLNNKEYLAVAERAVSFIVANLRQDNGRLLARYREGHSAYPGYLDDYAFLIWGLLELYTACGKPKYLVLALELQKDQEKLFTDSDKGGYFLTGSDAEELLIRPKESYDGALPSGNSISALNLLRLSRLTGDSAWETLAEKQIQVFKTIVSEHPTGYTAFLQAIQFALNSSQELILAGPLSSSKLHSMQQIIFNDFNPYSTVLYQEGSLDESILWLKDYPVNNEGTTAYLCQNFTCHNPVQNPEELASLLHS